MKLTTITIVSVDGVMKGLGAPDSRTLCNVATSTVGLPSGVS